MFEVYLPQWLYDQLKTVDPKLVEGFTTASEPDDFEEARQRFNGHA